MMMATTPMYRSHRDPMRVSRASRASDWDGEVGRVDIATGVGIGVAPGCTVVDVVRRSTCFVGAGRDVNGTEVVEGLIWAVGFGFTGAVTTGEPMAAPRSSTPMRAVRSAIVASVASIRVQKRNAR